MTKEDVAKKIVDDILADFTDRRGLRQGWDEIDADIQKEIIESWREIVIKGMKYE